MIIIVFGLPGTGKSYFSKRLATDIQALHLNTDKIREEYNKEGQYDEKTKQFIYDKLEEKMVRQVKKNNNIILDGTFHKINRREKVLKKIKKLNTPYYLIELKAEEDIIQSRLKEDRKHSEADFEIYRELKKEFEACKQEHLILWSNDSNIERLIKKAKEYIYERKTNTYTT